MNVTQKKEIESFIEESGLLFENLGSTRMAGRIYGYLLVSDKENVSFNELTEVLYASKSSISTNLKVLMQIGYLKITSSPADRKTYYSLNHEINHAEIVSNRLKLVNDIISKHNKALALRNDQTDNPSVWIKKTTAFYQWISDEMPDFLKRYHEDGNG